MHRWFVLGFFGLAGCHNACQDICVEMARYAEDECGYTIPDADVDACIEAQKESTPEDRQACRQNGNAGTIETEWGCDELENYFD